MKVTDKESSKEDKFMAALKVVRLQLATLKESVEKNQAKTERLTEVSPGYQSQQWNQRAIGCIPCTI